MPGDKRGTVLFFCGHRSTFGLQALAALQDSRLRPDYLILAKAARWQQFDRQLNQQVQKTVRQRWRARLVAARQYLLLLRIWLRRPMHIKWVGDVHEPAFLAWVQKQEGLVGIAAAFPQLFRPTVLIPFQGAIYNLHPSDLPNFAGAHPHFWAIRTGAEQLGLTAHEMTPKIDEGPIWAQTTFSIKGLRYRQLYKKIGRKLPELIGQLERQLLDIGAATGISYAVKHRFRNNQVEDSRIDWSGQESKEILQIIRTETAFCYLGEEKIRIWEAIPADLLGEQPGQIAQISNLGIEVYCKNGGMLIQTLKIGPRLQAATQFAKQRSLQAGHSFS